MLHPVSPFVTLAKLGPFLALVLNNSVFVKLLLFHLDRIESFISTATLLGGWLFPKYTLYKYRPRLFSPV
jgi:hypothetical protein